MDFFWVALQDQCFVAKHTVCAWMQANTHTVRTHIDIQSGGSCLLSPAPYPASCPSLSQMYFIINQLVAHLPACFFFSINKALIAFSLECDLARCVLSFWGCRPWRTRLDCFTSARSTGCYQTQALSQVPRSHHTAAKHKEDAAGQRQTQTAPVTHTPTAQDNGWRKQCIFQEETEEERRWTWGQSGRKVEI